MAKNKAIAYLNDKLPQDTKDFEGMSTAVYGALGRATKNEFEGLVIEIRKLVAKVKRSNKNLEQPHARKLTQWVSQQEHYINSAKQLLEKNPKGFAFNDSDAALQKPKNIPNVSQELITRLKADGVIPTTATPSNI